MLEILNDIIIYDHTNNNGNKKVIVSESGSMEITKDENFLEHLTPPFSNWRKF